MTAAYPGQARHAQVVHALGAAIVRGELGPGSPVPTEDELVGRFEVGRSALREGVKVLAGKGLLESRTSAGTRVRPRESWNLLDPDVLRWRYSPDASPADIRALADLRVALEPGAARLAAESASAAQRGVIAAAWPRCGPRSRSRTRSSRPTWPSTGPCSRPATTTCCSTSTTWSAWPSARSARCTPTRSRTTARRCRPSAGGRGHPARPPPEGGGRDARDRRGRPRGPDAASPR